MFSVSTEFRKGVFFIRLVGRIDNEGYLDDIDYLINSMGINLIVLNIDHLQDISVENIRRIILYNKEILKKKKVLYLCDNNNIRNRLFQGVIPKIRNEIDAFSLI